MQSQDDSVELRWVGEIAMAECIVCSEKLSFFNGDAYGRCKSCMKKDVWPDGHPQNHENNTSSNTENSQVR